MRHRERSLERRMHVLVCALTEEGNVSRRSKEKERGRLCADSGPLTHFIPAGNARINYAALGLLFLFIHAIRLSVKSMKCTSCFSCALY